MGFDLVNWSPIIPADPNYSIQGATKIGGVVDTANERVAVNVKTPPSFTASDSWSTIKNVLNLSVGYNQAIGLLNARILKYNLQYNSSVLLPLSYLQPGQFAKNFHVGLITSAITTLRNLEGLPPYSWSTIPSGPVNGSKQYGAYLSDIRRALRISGVLTLYMDQQSSPGAANGQYKAIDFAYNSSSRPAFNQIAYNTVSGATLGKNAAPSPEMDRYRLAQQFVIPGWLTGGIQSAKLNLNILSKTTTLESGFKFVIYSSNTDDHLFPSGFLYNTNNLENSALGSVAGTGPQDYSINPNSIYNMAGKYLCLILGSDMEIAGIGVATGSPGSGAYFSTIGTIPLKIDFGA